MRLLTVDEFERMFDAGILAEDDSVELLEGQLSVVSPQGPQHAAIIQWLATQLIRAIDPEIAAVRVQLPLRFLPVSEPEPDIAIVSAGGYSHEHPAEAMLVIEVAATSQQLDLGTKLEVYPTAAVAEYWVIDLPARTVHVHRSPAGAAYGSSRQVTGGSPATAVERRAGDRGGRAPQAAGLTSAARSFSSQRRPAGTLASASTRRPARSCRRGGDHR